MPAPLSMTAPPPPKAPAAAAAEWSALPDTALEIISMHLAASSTAYYFRFCSVCSSWRAAAAPRRLHLPFVVCGAGGWISRFLAFNGEALFPSTEPQHPAVPTGVLCFGSSRGWLTLFEPRSRLISLWKPFTGDIAWLPPLSKPVANIPDKLILSSPDPTADSGCMVVLIHHSPQFFRGVNKVSFCRVGDTKWTPIKKGPAKDLTDIVFFNGQAYFTSGHGSMFATLVRR